MWLLGICFAAAADCCLHLLWFSSLLEVLFWFCWTWTKTTLEVEMSKCYTKRSVYYLCTFTLYCSQPSQLNLSFSSLHFCIEMVWVIATELHTCMYKREYIWVLLAFCLQFSLNIFFVDFYSRKCVCVCWFCLIIIIIYLNNMFLCMFFVFYSLVFSINLFTPYCFLLFCFHAFPFAVRFWVSLWWNITTTVVALLSLTLFLFSLTTVLLILLFAWLLIASCCFLVVNAIVFTVVVIVLNNWCVVARNVLPLPLLLFSKAKVLPVRLSLHFNVTVVLILMMSLKSKDKVLHTCTHTHTHVHELHLDKLPKRTSSILLAFV